MKNQIFFNDISFLSLKPIKLTIALCCILFTPIKGQNNLNVIRDVLVNGAPKIIIDNTIEIKTSDYLTIILSKIPDSSLYTFQLIGKDTTPQREDFPVINYSSFSVGTFYFSVQKTDEINTASQQLQINITESFMDSWQFVPILLFYLFLLFGGAGFFILLSNFRNKEKLFDLRNDWTNKLHNDIGGDLSSVALRISSLDKKLGELQPELQKKVEKVYHILNDIQKKLRFVFDLVDPKKNSFQVMFSEIEDFAKENFALKNIKFQCENSLNLSQVESMDIGRINKIDLIMKEAINNAVKHSDASKASIEVHSVNKGILISIKDNGKGIDLNRKFDGNGINNLVQYGREGFIDVTIDSNPGQGTNISILVPKL